MGVIAPILPLLSVVTSVVGGIVGAAGAEQAAQAQADAANYQAQVAKNNAVIANQNAAWQAQAGETQAADVALKAKAQAGSIKAAMGANNIDVNTGSAADVGASEQELGQLDVGTTLSNSARAGYGFRTQATGDVAQAGLDTMQANSALAAGDINAFSSILGGVGHAASGWSNYQTSGGGFTAGAAPSAAGNVPLIGGLY